MAVAQRILYVNLEGHMSGAEVSMLLNIKYLSTKYILYVACPHRGKIAARIKPMGIKVFTIPETPKKNNSFVMWMLYFGLVNLRLLWITLLTRPKLIHANTTKAALATLLGGVLLRVKVLWHVRDMGCPQWVLGICSICSCRIIAVSWGVCNWLTERGVKQDKIEIIYNSVDLIQPTSKAYDVSSKTVLTYANIGQFVPWKKQILFIEAAEEFLAKGNKGIFLIIGSDLFGRDLEYTHSIKERISESKYSESFDIIPWQKNLDRLWQEIDCLVHTADKEPFGRVIIEAMENKVPVIAADSCGPSEIIQNCITGFLFQPDNTDELCHYMEVVSQNQVLIKNIVSAGFKYVCSNHDIHTMIERLERIYTDLMAA